MDRRNFIHAATLGASLSAGVPRRPLSAPAQARLQQGRSEAFDIIPLLDGGMADMSKSSLENVLIVPQGETALQYLGNARPGNVRHLRTSAPIDVLFEFDNFGSGTTLTGLNEFIARGGADARWTMTPDDSLTMLAMDQRNRAGERVWRCIAFNDKLVSYMLRVGGEGHRDPADKLFVVGKPKFLDAQPRMPVWGMMVDPNALEGAGKVHTGELDLLAVGDTTRIRFTALTRDPAGNPVVAGLGWPSGLQHRPAVKSPTDGKLDFVQENWPPLIPHAPGSLFQGIASSIYFDQLDTPTPTSTPGVIVFAAATGTTDGAIYGVTPWNRMWLNGESGNVVIVGKAAFEAGTSLRFGNPATWHSPAGDCDYKSTRGWGNLSIIMTDITSDRLGRNAALAMRCFGDHGAGVDFGYDAAARRWSAYRVKSEQRSPALALDLETGDVTIGDAPTGRHKVRGSVETPDSPAFEAGLGKDRLAITGDGTASVLAFDSVSYDRAGEFDPSTGIFTAEVSGLYHLQCVIQFGRFGRRDEVLIEILAGTRRRRLATGVPSADRNGCVGLSFAITTPMAKGETACVRVTISGGPKTVDCLADGTSFSGFLVG